MDTVRNHTTGPHETLSKSADCNFILYWS